MAVESISFREGRMACLVQLSPAAPRSTNSELAAAAKRVRPALPRHSCKNACGITFGDVMDSTPLPHLLEHLVIDLQCEYADSDMLYVGTTEWVSEQAGRAQVIVNFADDLIALRALRDALDVLNNLLEERGRL